LALTISDFMHRPIYAFMAGALLLSPGNIFADKNADLGKVFGKPATVDELNRAELGKEWAAAKGDWRIVDGAIVGKELKADKHAAVLSFQKKNTDSAIQFSFKLDGAKGFNLSYNKAVGHLFRVAVTAAGLTITLDKDKKDPKSKAVSLGKAAGKFEQGKWYTMLVVVEGTNVSVQTDNGVKVSGEHATLKVAKPNYRFVMTGESLMLDDLKIWQLK
jgi:hypothetical protein